MVAHCPTVYHASSYAPLVVITMQRLQVSDYHRDYDRQHRHHDAAMVMMIEQRMVTIIDHELMRLVARSQ